MLYLRLSLLLAVFSPSAESFIPSNRYSNPLSSQTVTNNVLSSTLAPTIPKIDDGRGDAPPKGGISMTIDELAGVLGGKGRAQLAWDCYKIGIDPALYFGSVIRLGHDDFETIYDLLPTSRRSQMMGSAALEELSSLYANKEGRVEGGVASLSNINQSHDRTTKMLLKLADGREVETVIIPWGDSHSTLCISSQVGCRQGCKFCATGRMGIQRSLTSDEILAQMFFARKICRVYELPDVRNVVFMGMGEPADNCDEVTAAIRILTDRDHFQFAASKVTVSTVAPTPEAFSQLSTARCVLAWSVHAANDDLRRKLVPTTKYSMVELRQGLIDALLQKPPSLRKCMLEVALIADVNDSLKEADELAEFAQGILDAVPGSKLTVNLIPFNDIGQSLYKKPSNESVQAFQKRLQSKDIYTHIRSTRGDDASSACGQLATKRMKP